jgi:hypothetical protein
MVFPERLLSILPGIAITVFIVLANFYQWKIRRRFSGVIGRIMYWYSFGLAAMLALTIWHWLVVIFEMSLPDLLWGDIVAFLLAAFFFFKGSTVIR